MRHPQYIVVIGDAGERVDEWEQNRPESKTAVRLDQQSMQPQYWDERQHLAADPRQAAEYHAGREAVAAAPEIEHQDRSDDRIIVRNASSSAKKEHWREGHHQRWQVGKTVARRTCESGDQWYGRGTYQQMCQQRGAHTPC